MFFYNTLTILYQVLDETLCTAQRCPVMSAGPQVWVYREGGGGVGGWMEGNEVVWHLTRCFFCGKTHVIVPERQRPGHILDA